MLLYTMISTTLGFLIFTRKNTFVMIFDLIIYLYDVLSIEVIKFCKM